MDLENGNTFCLQHFSKKKKTKSLCHLKSEQKMTTKPRNTTLIYLNENLNKRFLEFNLNNS